MYKFWMIIDIQWMLEARCVSDFRVPVEKRPAYCHGSKEAAERELIRLREKDYGEFVLLESVAYVQQGNANPGVIYVDRIEE